MYKSPRLRTRRRTQREPEAVLCRCKQEAPQLSRGIPSAVRLRREQQHPFALAPTFGRRYQLCLGLLDQHFAKGCPCVASQDLIAFFRRKLHRFLALPSPLLRFSVSSISGDVTRCSFKKSLFSCGSFVFEIQKLHVIESTKTPFIEFFKFPSSKGGRPL